MDNLCNFTDHCADAQVCECVCVLRAVTPNPLHSLVHVSLESGLTPMIPTWPGLATQITIATLQFWQADDVLHAYTDCYLLVPYTELYVIKN